MSQQGVLTRAGQPESVIDRTQILDVEKLWPDPLDCPDWPIEYDHGHTVRRHVGSRGRVGAMEKLEYLGGVLNRGGRLHKPSEAERQDAFSRVFARGGTPTRTASALGIMDIGPLDRTTEAQAEMIMQAAHVRGYLRKLDALEAKAAEGTERRQKASAQATIDDFKRLVSDGRAELTELAEAEARHRQRIEDEQAFIRCNALRHDIRLSHGRACQAAQELGVEAPPTPTFF